MIRVENVGITRGTKTVCYHLTLSISAGKMVAILGPNGSGKTSLLHTLAGLQPSTQGSIFLNEKNIQGCSEKKLAHMRAILLQENEFSLSQSVTEAVMMGRYPWMSLWEPTALHQGIVDSYLEVFSLRSLKHRGVETLSGGERRRVALARLFAQETPLLFLDEPTNHLDMSHAIHLLQQLRASADREKKIIVLTTHDLNLVSHYCDYVILLYEHGRTVVCDVSIVHQRELEALYKIVLHESMRNGKRYWMMNYEELP